jgi:glycosyltransferase involved in cell wall biosynthesis
VAGFARAAVRLLGDRALSERLGAAGRARAEALFGVRAHATRVVDAYRCV